MSTGSDPFPLGKLVYLYIGSNDIKADLAWYDEALGGDLVWRFEAFGADVAAVRVGSEGSPLVVLADHRRCRAAAHLGGALVGGDERMAARDRMARQRDARRRPRRAMSRAARPSGNEIALLQQDRPDAMTSAYDDMTNPRRR